MTIDKEALRPAFERWYSDEGSYPTAVERDPNGQYMLLSAGNAWDAWCADFESLGEPAAHVADLIGMGQTALLPEEWNNELGMRCKSISPLYRLPEVK